MFNDFGKQNLDSKKEISFITGINISNNFYYVYMIL